MGKGRRRGLGGAGSVCEARASGKKFYIRDKGDPLYGAGVLRDPLVTAHPAHCPA